jgi:hypothetical protein
MRGERRLRVLENRVLKRIFGEMRDEVTGEGRKLHNEELNDLYCLLFVFLALQPIVVVFSQPGSGLNLLAYEVT